MRASRFLPASQGNDGIKLSPGKKLDEGYVVKSVEAVSLVLLYPPIGTISRIALPHGQSGSP